MKPFFIGLRLSVVSATLLFDAAFSFSQTPLAASPETPSATSNGKIDAVGVTENPEPFTPRLRRDEQGEDQILASALLSQARLFFRREQFVEALQAYERAYRYAGAAPAIASQIVPLAFQLGRTDEAMVYAKRADKDVELDPLILNRLSLDLTAHQNYHGALELYRLAAHEEDSLPQGAAIVMRFEMGRLLYLTEQFEEAATTFELVRKALEQPAPSRADQPAIQALLEHAEITFALMAEAALKAKQIDEAERLFRRAYQDRPDNALLQFHHARIALERQDAAAAEDALGAYLKTGLTEAGIEPYEILGRLLDLQNRSDELLPRLELLHAAQPQNLFLAYYLGESLLKTGKTDEAVRILEGINERKPLTDATRLLIEAHLARRDANGCLRVLAEAVGRWSELDLMQPQLNMILQDAAFCDQLLAVTTPEAERAARALPVGVSRHESPRAFALGQLCDRLGRVEDADAYYGVATGEGPTTDAEAGLAWGLSYLLAEQPAKAEDVFRRVLAGQLQESERGLMEYHLASVLAVKEKYQDAYELAKAASGRLPDAPMLQVQPAWVLLRAGRWQEAYDAYQAFLKKFEDVYGDKGVRAVVREAKSNLANVCVKLNRPEEAEELLERILDEFPEDIGIQNDLGYMWADRGVHLQRALRMTQAAIEAEPENPAYQDSLGWVLYQLGRYPEAVEQLRKAVNRDQPDGVILDHLAEALLHAEGAEAARAVWQQALDAFDSSDTVERAKIQEKLANKVAE